MIRSEKCFHSTYHRASELVTYCDVGLSVGG